MISNTDICIHDVVEDVQEVVRGHREIKVLEIDVVPAAEIDATVRRIVKADTKNN